MRNLFAPILIIASGMISSLLGVELGGIAPNATVIEGNWVLTSYVNPNAIQKSLAIRKMPNQVVDVHNFDYRIDFPETHLRLMHLSSPVKNADSTTRAYLTPQVIGKYVVQGIVTMEQQGASQFDFTKNKGFGLIEPISVYGVEAHQSRYAIIAKTPVMSFNSHQFQVGGGYFQAQLKNQAASGEPLKLCAIRSGMLAAKDQLPEDYPIIFLDPSMNQRINHEILRFSLGDQSGFQRVQ
jgi:hypothetical protein